MLISLPALNTNWWISGLTVCLSIFHTTIACTKKPFGLTDATLFWFVLFVVVEWLLCTTTSWALRFGLQTAF
jgi:hypothetical protein